MRQRRDRRSSWLTEAGRDAVAYTAIFAVPVAVVVAVAGEPWWVVPLVAASLAVTLLIVSSLRDELSKRHALLPFAAGLVLAVVYGWTSAGWAWVVAVVGSALAVRMAWEIARRVRRS